MIDKNTIDRIKSACDIVEVIGTFVTLRKSGVNMVGMCPFHNDSRPSMTVSKAKQHYKCFVCGEGGDVIQFIMKHENYSFYEAASWCAKHAGIEFVNTEQTDEERARAKEVESLRIAIKAAADYYNRNLIGAKEYLLSRHYDLKDGATQNLLNTFCVGYAPEGNLCKKELTKAGYADMLLQRVDVLKRGDHGTYDTFRDRLMFPFFDVQGNVVGFSGRMITPKENTGKYVNTADTALFTKGRHIFGLFQAKQAIGRNGCAYLVEGQMDVLSMYASGVTNTIAGSGTALQLSKFAYFPDSPTA